MKRLYVDLIMSRYLILYWFLGRRKVGGVKERVEVTSLFGCQISQVSCKQSVYSPMRGQVFKV